MNKPTTTTALIPIIEDPKGEQTVNARDLHSFLEVGRDFSTWVKDRISSLGFAEDLDFVITPETGDISRRGPKRIEYHLGLRMARHLSMIERTKKGEDARDYFIECERIAKGKELSPGEFLVQQAQMLLRIEQEQKRQEEHRRVTDERMEHIENQINVRSGYYTILAWANIAKLKIPIDMANRLGRVCSKLSKEREVLVGKVPDTRFGSVNSYHETILKEIIGVGEMYDE